jgi:DNA-binding beta-propeller fold protein YncE
MQRFMYLFVMGALFVFLVGCSRKEGTCDKDSQCPGANVCFEDKCVGIKERAQLLNQRQEAERPKVCEDKDGDGFFAGDGCPAGTPLDCDDTNKDIAPGKPELCDDVDNNCDGRNNEGLTGCVGTLFGIATAGTAAAALLDGPRSIFYDPAGFVLVTDNHRLWKITLDGKAEVLAGNPIANYADGPGPEARFSFPEGLTKLPDGNMVVADCKNNCLRKVSPAGTVSTLAGLCSGLTKNTNQYADGSLENARFYCPSDVALAPDGSLIVVDQGNARIRRISPNNRVTTIAGVGPVEVEEGVGQIGFLDGPALKARFNQPQAVLVDKKGIIYISESFNCRIRRLDLTKGENGTVTTLAGTSDTQLGVGGFADGPGARAKFSFPHGIAFDKSGNIIVADSGNGVLRLVTPQGMVRTLYGSPTEAKAIDGPLGKARFLSPMDVAAGPNGSLFVVDTAANRVRLIVP